MAENRKAETRRWFQESYYDLQAVRWNIQGKFYNTACFLAQQSGEKALKSLLYYFGARKKAIHTHSLFEMTQTLVKEIPSLEILIKEAKELDLHYVPSRYPNGLPGGFPHLFYESEMANKALSSAEKLFSAAQNFYKWKEEEEILKSEE